MSELGVWAVTVRGHAPIFIRARTRGAAAYRCALVFADPFGDPVGRWFRQIVSNRRVPGAAAWLLVWPKRGPEGQVVAPIMETSP